MVGAGAVFRMYRDGPVEADDEVAVAHADGPDYRRLSEPLVNILSRASCSNRMSIAALAKLPRPESIATGTRVQGQTHDSRDGVRPRCARPCRT